MSTIVILAHPEDVIDVDLTIIEDMKRRLAAASNADIPEQDDVCEHPTDIENGYCVDCGVYVL